MDDIVAKFRADVEGYKKDVNEAAQATGNLDAKVKQTQTSTNQFSKQTKDAGAHVKSYGESAKTAAGSINTLSRGLGGISGILAITGKLFGVNTDSIRELASASSEFIRVGRDISHAQHLANVALAESADVTAAAEGATVRLTAAEKILQAVRSFGLIGWGLVAAAVTAVGVAIYSYIRGLKDEEEQLKRRVAGVKENIKLNNELAESFNKSAKTQAEANIAQLKADGAISDKEAEQLLIKQEFADKKLQINKEFNRKRASLSEEELKSASTTFVSSENRLLTLSEELESKRTKLLAAAERDRDAHLSAIKSKFDDIANKEKEKRDQQAKEKALKALNDRANEERDAFEKINQYRIDSLKLTDKEEIRINLEILRRKISDGSATMAEIKAVADYDIEQSKKATDAQIEDFKARQDAQEKFTAYRIASLTGHNKEEEKIALETIRTRKKLNTATEAELKALDEHDKKIRDKRIDDEKQMLDTIFKAQEEAYNRNKELQDTVIDDQKKNIDVQRDLAARGLSNTLAFEERRLVEQQRTQEKEAQVQKRIKLLETFLNSLASFSKEDPKTALSKALLQVALATAATAVFAEEGGVIGEVGARSNLRRRHKGGGDVLLHAQKGEGILPVDSMNAIGRRNFELLKNAGRFPIRDNIFTMPKQSNSVGVAVMDNSEVIKELRHLQNVVKNKKENTYHIDEFGNYIKTQIENGFKEVTKGKLSKPRFNGRS